MKKRHALKRQDTSSTLTNSRPSVVEINEILAIIFSFLSQATLKSVAARVSHRWYLVASKLFVHHLCLDPKLPQTWKNLLRRMAFADQFTVGRTIQPHSRVLDRNETSSWNKMMTLLARDLYSAPGSNPGRGNNSDLSNGSSGHYGIKSPSPLQTTVLNLNLENWSISQSEILTWFSRMSQTLTELSMDLPLCTGPTIMIGKILESCPCLLSLSISAYKYNPDTSFGRGMQGALMHVYTFEGMDTRIQEDISDVKNTTPIQVLRLRSFFLHSMIVPPGALTSCLRNLKQLTDLRILDARYSFVTSGQDSFHCESARNAFWRSLVETCPLLKVIQFTSCAPTDWEVPVHLFPRATSWGIDGGQYLTALDMTLARLAVNRRLTTLDILGEGILSNSARDRLIHRLLCVSPQLVHFKTGEAKLSPDVLWDPEDTTAIWSCRGLLTLSIRLDSQQHEQLDTAPFWTGRVFGYLGRVCPKLLDLSLQLNGHTLSLESGLCLLTRITNLRRLQLSVEALSFPSGRDRSPKKRDFVWLRGQRDSVHSQASSPATSCFASICTVMDRWLRDPSQSLQDDYQHCLGRIRQSAFLFPDTGSAHLINDMYRSSMCLQQQRNCFRTDYDRPMPMVDGLDDFAFCGSYLDIEAYFQARLWDVQSAGAIAADAEPNSFFAHSRPWPCMEQISFVCRRRRDEMDLTLRKQMDQIRTMRPDISFSCEFWEKEL